MTIDELIELLSDYRDELGGDTEVRIMTQPAWPFEHGVCGLTSGEEINDDADPIIYIVEGDQLGYGDKRAWETARTQP